MVLQAVTAVINAHLTAAESSLATAAEAGQPTDLYTFGPSLAAQQAEIDTSFSALQQRFADLAASYRHIRAACESLLTSMDAAVEAREAGQALVSTGTAAGGGGGLEGEGGERANAFATPSSDAPLHQRARVRLAELLEELIGGYAMQLSLTVAVITRLQPQQRSEGAGHGRGQRHTYSLPSFSSVHTPGLPPWAQGDREHLTALASTLALPPYTSKERDTEVLEACELILRTGLSAGHA